MTLVCLPSSAWSCLLKVAMKLSNNNNVNTKHLHFAHSKLLAKLSSLHKWTNLNLEWKLSRSFYRRHCMISPKDINSQAFLFAIYSWQSLRNDDSLSGGGCYSMQQFVTLNQRLIMNEYELLTVTPLTLPVQLNSKKFTIFTKYTVFTPRRTCFPMHLSIVLNRL